MLLKMINRDMKIIMLAGIIATIIAAILCSFINITCSVICFVLGAALTLLFFICTKKRYDRLNNLNNYLSQICSGNYYLDIADNTEGELSILKNNLYKVITILKTQNEALESDKIYLADSLADISHQLKTPLTSMMVMSDLLKKEKSEAKRNEFLTVIENQLDKMKWLITNLLKISKIDAGTISLNIESISSADIISCVVEPFAVTLDLKGIDFSNDITDFNINIDKQWTIEAMQNILKNCIEHTPSGGKISVCGEETSLYSAVKIKDNGVGISKEDLPHIFERFYHGKNSSAESVGIGLALAKAIFEKENADVLVNSEEGKGTQFTIKFYKAII